MRANILTGQFFRGIRVVTEKNIQIYYTKAPVLIFGLLFPLFLFLAFYLGKKLDMYVFFPGLLAMSLFFTSSSVGPLITPWEKQAGTYERLLSFPVSINTIIFGDIVAGMLFGMVINVFVLVAGMLFLGYSCNIPVLFSGMIIASFCFSSLGVFLASPAARAPSNIMMLSSLVRFPLIFISGIFIPLSELGDFARVLSYFSPITYFVDIVNIGLRGISFIPITIDFAALLAFSIFFITLSNRFHKRNLMKGL